jgi:hypothetical protein
MDPVYMGIDQRLGVDFVVLFHPRRAVNIHRVCLNTTGPAVVQDHYLYLFSYSYHDGTLSGANQIWTMIFQVNFLDWRSGIALDNMQSWSALGNYTSSVVTLETSTRPDCDSIAIMSLE